MQIFPDPAQAFQSEASRRCLPAELTFQPRGTPVEDIGRPVDPVHSDRARQARWPSILCGVLWACYLLTTPFYVFPSGTPQLGDWLIVLLFGLLLVFGQLQLPRGVLPVLLALIVFFAYVIAVNSVWAVILVDFDAMKASAYFIFNLMAVFVFVSMYSWCGVRFLNWTGLGAVASMSLQILLYIGGFHGGSGRTTLFFNNPNQLGFYAILYGSLCWVWSNHVKLPVVLRALLPPVVFSMVAFLSVLSMSRAAVAGAVAMLGIGCLIKMRLAVPMLGLLLLAGSLGLTSQQFQEFEARLLERRQSADLELKNRGYDRLLEFPEYLFLGASEGAMWRFGSMEFHSTPGTFLFCYGMVGLLLFGNIIWSIARTCGIGSLLYVIPMAMYCMTHNGHRQTEFWILLVLITCLRHAKVRWPQRQFLRVRPAEPPSWTSRARTGSVLREGVAFT